MPSPVRRIAPKPRRCTESSPPSDSFPAKLAESSFLFMIALPYFLTRSNHARTLTPLVRQLSAPESLVIRFALAKPLWVRVGTVEPMTRFIKLELAGRRGFRGFREKRRNL